MTRFFLIALLALSSGPAYAEWVLVGEASIGIAAYVDPYTIRRNGDRVKMWELLDFKTIQTASGISYLSKKVKSEYDCTQERFRLLALTEFLGHMGNGGAVYIDSHEDKWRPVVPGGIAQTLWKIACE